MSNAVTPFSSISVCMYSLPPAQIYVTVPTVGALVSLQLQLPRPQAPTTASALDGTTQQMLSPLWLI